MTTVHEAAGGDEGLVRLAAAWHQRVLADEVVAHAFHPPLHPQHVERLAAYWAEALGGPTTYSDTMGDETSVGRTHSGNGPHGEMDDRAIACFDAALDDIGLEDPVGRCCWPTSPGPPARPWPPTKSRPTTSPTGCASPTGPGTASRTADRRRSGSTGRLRRLPPGRGARALAGSGAGADHQGMVLVLLLCWCVTTLARGVMTVVDRLIPRPDAVPVEAPIASRR